MSDNSDTSGAILFALFIAWLVFDPTTTVRVQEFSCEGLVKAGACDGKLVEGSRQKFKVNRSTQAIARTTSARGNNESVTRIFRDCDVVDAENWLCRQMVFARLYSEFGFINGAYISRNVADGTTQSGEAGLAGYRYWLHLSGLVQIAPEWAE